MVIFDIPYAYGNPVRVWGPARVWNNIIFEALKHYNSSSIIIAEPCTASIYAMHTKSI